MKCFVCKKDQYNSGMLRSHIIKNHFVELDDLLVKLSNEVDE